MKQEPVQVAIGPYDGKVIMKFDRPIDYLEMEHENAFLIAEHIAQSAFESRDGIKPAGETLKAELIERHRMTLTARVALMLATIRGDKKISDGKVAQQVVEACLKEVF